jgi:hypothetical protein
MRLKHPQVRPRRLNWWRHDAKTAALGVGIGLVAIELFAGVRAFAVSCWLVYIFVVLELVLMSTAYACVISNP